MWWLHGEIDTASAKDHRGEHRDMDVGEVLKNRQ